jgi:hypothetical protein
MLYHFARRLRNTALKVSQSVSRAMPSPADSRPSPVASTKVVYEPGLMVDAGVS